MREWQHIWASAGILDLEYKPFKYEFSDFCKFYIKIMLKYDVKHVVIDKPKEPHEYI